MTATDNRHTPRPWAYDEATGRIYHSDGDVEPTIAFVDLENTTPEQAKADGRLLAAAPELLAACQMLLVRLDLRKDLPKGSVYDFAVATIATATGKTEWDSAPEIARFDSFEIEARIRHWEDGDPYRPDHIPCDSDEEHEATCGASDGARPGQHSVCIGEYATRAIAEDVYAGITGRRYGTPS